MVRFSTFVLREREALNIHDLIFAPYPPCFGEGGFFLVIRNTFLVFTSGAAASVVAGRVTAGTIQKFFLPPQSERS